MSELEYTLGKRIEQSWLPPPVREYRFDKIRKWRFDFAWPDYMVAVEVDGGIYSRGRHVRGKGFKGDVEKRNAAVMAGWRVLHFTSEHVVESDFAIREIEDFIEKIIEEIEGDAPSKSKAAGER